MARISNSLCKRGCYTGPVHSTSCSVSVYRPQGRAFPVDPAAVSQTCVVQQCPLQPPSVVARSSAVNSRMLIENDFHLYLTAVGGPGFGTRLEIDQLALARPSEFAADPFDRGNGSQPQPRSTLVVDRGVPLQSGESQPGRNARIDAPPLLSYGGIDQGIRERPARSQI